MFDFFKIKIFSEDMNILTMITAIIVALITALFGPIIVTWIKNKIENRKNIKNNNPIDDAIQLNSLIDEQLEILKEELECDRIWIGQFHNGGHYYPTGKAIQKFSIFYERVEPDIISLRNIFQNIPVSFFPKTLCKVYHDGELSINSYEPGNETYDLDSFSKLYGTKSIHIFAIDDIKDRFIGILTIAYANKEHTITEDEWVFIKQKLGVIGTLLYEYLKKKSIKPFS